LANKARELSQRAAKEKSLDGIAKELKVSVQKSPALGRETNDATFSAAIIQKLFTAPPGGIDFGPQADGNFLIAKITGIAHPPINPRDPNFQAGIQRVSQAMAQDFSIDMNNAARTRQGVKINQKLVSQITEGNQ